MEKQRLRLDRLMRKLPDGSYVIAGYQLQHKGLTYHAEGMFGIEDIKLASMSPTSYRPDFDNEMERRAYLHSVYHIPHTRIDEYVGVNLIDGSLTKIFENDKIRAGKNGRVKVVYFDNGRFMVRDEIGEWKDGEWKSLEFPDTLGMWLLGNRNHEVDLIGIEGVKSK